MRAIRKQHLVGQSPFALVVASGGGCGKRPSLETWAQRAATRILQFRAWAAQVTAYPSEMWTKFLTRTQGQERVRVIEDGSFVVMLLATLPDMVQLKEETGEFCVFSTFFLFNPVLHTAINAHGIDPNSLHTKQQTLTVSFSPPEAYRLFQFWKRILTNVWQGSTASAPAQVIEPTNESDVRVLGHSARLSFEGATFQFLEKGQTRVFVNGTVIVPPVLPVHDNTAASGGGGGGGVQMTVTWPSDEDLLAIREFSPGPILEPDESEDGYESYDPESDCDDDDQQEAS